MKPTVSIIIPAYNAGPWIEATLASALVQTAAPVEIIVIDDGSRDDTLARARRTAAAAAGRIRVETQANAGAAAARNHGLRHARGEFIQFLDADDLLAPRKLERQLALLPDRPPETVATCRWGRFEADPATARFADAAVERDFTPLDWMRLHCGTGAMMHPAAWLVPRPVADRAGPWDESLSLNDDGEYFARVVLASAGIAFCADPDAVCYYRSGIATSLSRSRSPRALASLQRSIELVAAHVTAGAGADAAAPATRRALANYWQRLAYELYPDDPAGSRAAAARARALGGASTPPPLGARWQTVARLGGWHLAFRLRRLFNR